MASAFYPALASVHLIERQGRPLSLRFALEGQLLPVTLFQILKHSPSHIDGENHQRW